MSLPARKLLVGNIEFKEDVALLKYSVDFIGFAMVWKDVEYLSDFYPYQLMLTEKNIVRSKVIEDQMKVLRARRINNF